MRVYRALVALFLLLFSGEEGKATPLKPLYLEGQGDLVSRLITPLTHIVSPIIPIINLVTKSP